jgi:flagellar biosynthesis protein FlhB
MALKIEDVSQEHDIHLVENKPWAQILHKIIEIGALFPSNLYSAVTAIMTNVYKASSVLCR